MTVAPSGDPLSVVTLPESCVGRSVNESTTPFTSPDSISSGVSVTSRPYIVAPRNVQPCGAPFTRTK